MQMRLVQTVSQKDFYGRYFNLWWGKAYPIPERREFVLALIPLNLILGVWMNRIYPFLRHGVYEGRFEAEYSRGYREGWADANRDSINEERAKSRLANVKAGDVP